ncbi:MAG: ComF family protein [Candidatus Paceibacterota bacterium]
MISSLLDFIFPRVCIGCGAKEMSLCKRCLSLSRKALKSPDPYTITLFDFKDPTIKRAIHALKYYHRKDVVIPLTQALAQKLRSIPQIETYTLIPIPMPHIRKLLRGYNQSELIAHELSVALSIPVRTDILVRSKNPTRQVTMHSKKEREQNQKGSFSVITPITDGRFLLVDDVSTTGATLHEARQTLLSSKASLVLGATLAH